jgi:hypothetical protein
MLVVGKQPYREAPGAVRRYYSDSQRVGPTFFTRIVTTDIYLGGGYPAYSRS